MVSFGDICAIAVFERARAVVVTVEFRRKVRRFSGFIINASPHVYVFKRYSIKP
jgi:hypothetical protein